MVPLSQARGDNLMVLSEVSARNEPDTVEDR